MRPGCAGFASLETLDAISPWDYNRTAGELLIGLEDPRWQDLEHAYGAAGDVPVMIAQLRDAGASEREKIWFDLWSALCHQSDVYTGSFAAVPHIMRLAEQSTELDFRVQAVHFIAVVEAYRHKSSAPEVPDDLSAEYHEAIRRLPALVADTLPVEWSAEVAQVMCGALAISKGQPRLGSAILDIEDVIECPECHSTFPTLGWDLNE